MIRRGKLMLLGALAASGSFLLAGCLGSFWEGFAVGWPANNRWLNIALDVVREAATSTN